MERTITITLNGDETAVLMEAMYRYTEYQLSQPASPERGEKMAAGLSLLNKAAPQVLAHAADEARERKSQWN